MHVVHIITGLGMGGAESSLYRLLKNTKSDLEFKSSVISLTDFGVYGDELCSDGITTIALGLKSPLKLFGKIFKLRSLIKSLSPDCVHLWMYHPILLAPVLKGPWAIVGGVRASLHALGTEQFITQIVIRCSAVSSYFLDALIFNSKVSESQHHSIGFAKKACFYFPNGYDMEQFSIVPSIRQSIRTELGVTKSDFLIGHVGRFHEVKNQETLVSAIGQVVQAGLNVKLLLVGTDLDNDNAVLADWIKCAGLVDRTILIGATKNVTSYMNACDIFVTLSRAESFPNVVAEAMAMQLPVIATDVGQTSELIGVTGILVHPENAKAAAQAISELFEMDVKSRTKLGKMARKRISQDFSQDINSANYIDVYNQVIS